MSGGQVSASVAGELRSGIEATGTAPDTTVESTVATVINVFSFIVGVISVIMIIIGGLKYITSTGDSNKTESAKNTILYAVIGLAVVALAQVIVLFVLNRVGGDSVNDSSSNEGDSSLAESMVV